MYITPLQLIQSEHVNPPQKKVEHNKHHQQHHQIHPPTTEKNVPFRIPLRFFGSKPCRVRNNSWPLRSPQKHRSSPNPRPRCQSPQRWLAIDGRINKKGIETLVVEPTQLKIVTLSETNIAPENEPLEKEIPIFRCYVSFRAGIWIILSGRVKMEIIPPNVPPPEALSREANGLKRESIYSPCLRRPPYTFPRLCFNPVC